MSRASRKAVLVALLVAAAASAHATPPCPSSPCFKHSGLDTAFDESACRDASTWIAIGRIVGVHRRHEGPPRNRIETATFELQIVRWEKGARPAHGTLKLNVGRCGPSLPRSIGGLWRLWGTGGAVPDVGGDKADTADRRVLFLHRLRDNVAPGSSSRTR